MDYRRYRTRYGVFLLVLLGGYGVAILTYGEPFLLWQHPFSGLGASETPGGFLNYTSMVVFVTDMTLCGIILLNIMAVYIRDREITYRSFRIVFSAIGALGAFIATFPHNIFDVQHMVGSGFFVGSLWVIAVLFITDVRARVSINYSNMLHVILHTTVLSYAITYVFGADSKQVFQKFATVGLALGIMLSLGALCRSRIVEGEALEANEAESTNAEGV